MSQPLTYDSGIFYDAPALVWDGLTLDPIIAMPTDNRISAVISPTDKTDVLDAIELIRTKLPFLVNLTATERKDMPKLGDKSVAFDEKCASYMTAHPELVPGFIDAAELTKDRNLRTDLNDIYHELQQVTEGVGDTIMLASSEAFKSDLAFYQNVSQAAKRGVVGADSIFNDLKQRFPGRPPGGSTPPTPPGP